MPLWITVDDAAHHFHAILVLQNFLHVLDYKVDHEFYIIVTKSRVQNIIDCNIVLAFQQIKQFVKQVFDNCFVVFVNFQFFQQQFYHFLRKIRIFTSKHFIELGLQPHLKRQVNVGVVETKQLVTPFAFVQLSHIVSLQDCLQDFLTLVFRRGEAFSPV